MNKLSNSAGPTVAHATKEHESDEEKQNEYKTGHAPK